MNVIFYVMGVSGCGKSTIGKLLAAHYGLPFFDGDDFHPKANVKKMSAGKPLNDNDRQGWLERLNALASEHAHSGAVIACSALKADYRSLLTHNLADKATFIYLKGSFDDINDRLQQRKNHFMPKGLLQSQFDTLEEPRNAITVSIRLSPEAIIAAIVKAYPKKRP